MKIYLAGPMKGIEFFNKPAFDAAAEKLRALGNEVFNPHDAVPAAILNKDGSEAEAVLAGFNRRATMAADLSWICLEADAIAMLPGWRNSSGARGEKAVAEALPIEILYLS